VFESRRVPVITQLTIKVSPARRAFKDMLGQNNHFLVTIMIGLDAVAKGEARPGEDFSTRWDPRDIEQSARRSREFACKALTAWLSDSVAAYIRNLLADPNIISDSDLAASVRAAEPLDEKVQILASACGDGESVPTLLVRAAIIWRNRLVHYQARNKMDRTVASMLRQYDQEIASDYQGLDIARMLDSIDKSHAPTFKETTSLVHAAHKFVEQIDGKILERSDLDRYVMSVLARYVSADPVSRTSNVWGKDGHRRLASVVQICKQYGMTDSDRETLNFTSEGMLEAIGEWTPTEARDMLRK
jgi:hypothetical protein